MSARSKLPSDFRQLRNESFQLRLFSEYCWASALSWCASGRVQSRIFNREVTGSNLGLGYFAPRSTQPSIPPGSVNEYQLQLGRQLGKGKYGSFRLQMNV